MSDSFLWRLELILGILICMNKIVSYKPFLDVKCLTIYKSKNFIKKVLTKLFYVWYHVIKDKEMKQLNGTVYDVDTLKKKIKKTVDKVVQL